MGAEFLESDNPASNRSGQGREHPVHIEHRPGLGSPIRFQVWLRHGLWVPAWVAVCGAVASRGLTLSSEPLLRLVLLVFLVDVIWGGLWSGLVATDWATPLRRWQDWRHGSPVRLLPYTSPNGPAGRLARTWGQLRDWWAELGRPTLGSTLSGLVLLLPLALVVAGVLGARPLVITLAAITLLQFIFAWSGGNARPVSGPQALFEITLPWLAGHALFVPPTFSSIALALAYGLSYAGALRLIHERPGLVRWNLGQGIAIIVLVASRHPLAAGVCGVFFIGQAIAQPGLFDAETEHVVPVAAKRFSRVAQLWLMAAMLIAAWGVRAAGAGG